MNSMNGSPLSWAVARGCTALRWMPGPRFLMLMMPRTLGLRVFPTTLNRLDRAGVIGLFGHACARGANCPQFGQVFRKRALGRSMPRSHSPHQLKYYLPSPSPIPLANDQQGIAKSQDGHGDGPAYDTGKFECKTAVR